jgi:hypothetical protein
VTHQRSDLGFEVRVTGPVLEGISQRPAAAVRHRRRRAGLWNAGPQISAMFGSASGATALDRRRPDGFWLTWGTASRSGRPAEGSDWLAAVCWRKPVQGKGYASRFA